MQLRDVAPDRYAREVLPQTAALWAGRRDFDTYVAQTLEIARSPYGRRWYRTAALYAGDAMVASFKRYGRTLYAGGERLRASGIGAVFTPPEYRGRGYASAMLAMELDRARRDGCDVVYLFSDIRPQFYAELGFRELPSREISLRSDRLPAQRLAPARMQERDWSGIRRCYQFEQRHSAAGFTRTPLVWGWMQMRMRHGSERTGGQETDLVVRRGDTVAAYVLGERDAARDTYVLDEIGYAGERGAAAAPALLRAAAGDLRRISGWLPPQIVRRLLPKGSVRKRREAIFMAAALSARGSRLVSALADCGDADPCWRADHI
jgi:GNAT superfamily N-acetyltransferase